MISARLPLGVGQCRDIGADLIAGLAAIDLLRRCERLATRQLLDHERIADAVIVPVPQSGRDQ